jgi:hypothetical protein
MRPPLAALERATPMENFNFVGVLVRWLLSFVLVLLTFNPTGYSFIHWLAEGEATPAKAVAGVALLIAWIIFVRSTLQSIGVLGVVLCGLLFAALVWLFASWNWLDLHSQSALTWLGLLLISFVLAAGLSWAHIRKRLSGQATVDEIEEH